MAFLKAAVLGVLVAPTVGISTHPRLRGGQMVNVPMMLFRHDCGRASGASFVQNPGAGMSPGAITPFETVLKDGFYEVDCIKDYLFEHGDKFGDNSASYKLGDVTNISIVHYSEHVPKEDREQMTHEVCFRFCRTVPEMTFFGLTNGRQCYCAPYYEAEASDSSECDAVCDGDNGLMCGGKSKSSVFAMHMCSTTVVDLARAGDRSSKVSADLKLASAEVTETHEAMRDMSDEYQKIFGAAGDPGAADLMQKAKVFDGKLAEALRRAAAVQEKSDALASEVTTVSGGPLTTSESVTKAEELIKTLGKVTVTASASLDELNELASANNASGVKAQNASQQYYSAMYFVDKNHKDVPSTCTGEASEEPMVTTQDSCARACDNDVHECVAYQYFPTPLSAHDESLGLCFTFKKLKTIRYYTDCEEDLLTFGKGVRCYGKLSHYESTNIKPDASGKCEGCLKEAKQADRCFESSN